MKKVFTIYRVTNLENGKTYVGFDSRWPRRKNSHIKLSLSNKNCGYFVNALRKHGEDSFVWDILYQSLDGYHCLNVMENHFIVENDSFGDNGYNLTLGGDGSLGMKQSDETKRKKALAQIKVMSSDGARTKISLAKTGKPHSASHRTSLSIALLGKPKSNETRVKMSIAKTGKKCSSVTRMKMSLSQIKRRFDEARL